jgi:hypothetical protein
MAQLLGVAVVVMISGLMLAVNAINIRSIYSGTTTDQAFNRTGLREMDSTRDNPPDFGRNPRGCFSNIEFSEEYAQKVNNILSDDTDIQKLLSEGYNVTSIRPLIKSVVNADGTVTSKATIAIVNLENGTTGFATVKIDVELGKVNQIEIVTRTIIDKTTD